MEAELRANLDELAKAYAAAKGLKLSTVAQKAFGDWRFFDRIGDGASFTARTYDAGVAWFARNWPEDVAWPQAVARPEAA